MMRAIMTPLHIDLESDGALTEILWRLRKRYTTVRQAVINKINSQEVAGSALSLKGRCSRFYKNIHIVLLLYRTNQKYQLNRRAYTATGSETKLSLCFSVAYVRATTSARIRNASALSSIGADGGSSA
ncbi:hypothetical protein NIES4071_107370 (plasmid) [Calothrix sp. NIES-4071]|nr:hypothetical protein NIES4071_107370 [Calothrix sp. NIES-4071]BAZ64777.1 hypothetical protein NIES4105_105100 [Calothrix sp. NIES-4105]